MLALLTKLIPLKDWVYLGIILGLLAGFGVYTVHERHIGAAKIEAVDAKAAAAQVAHDKQVETNAANAISALSSAYNARVSAPPSPSAPHVIVRYGKSSGSCAVPGNASSPGSTDAKTSVPAESTVDIGPPLDKVGSDADAQVIALQAYITACQQAGICKR